MNVGYRRGLALIIVVGVLGLLAALAMAFTTLAQIERRASRQRLHATKAALLARSGIEDALARLGAGQDPEATGSRYGGEDWDNSSTLNGFEGAAEVYRTGTLNRDDCPVRHALRPSFFVRSWLDLGADGLPAPARVRAGDRTRGCSGVLAPDLGDQGGAPDRVISGNFYALKVTPQAGIYVNGGDPTAATDVGYNAVLRRILGNLAEAIDREVRPPETGTNNGLPADFVDGQKLIDLRPKEGWTSFEQVRDVAFQADPLLSVRQAKLDALRSYLTLRAWVDTRTLKPDATNITQTLNIHTWSEIRLGVGALYAPTRGMPTLEPRAPVNLAWARGRWPVLVALMGGLKGLYLNEQFARNGTSTGGGVTDSIGRMQPSELALSWTSAMDPCRRVATRLAAYSGPLNTWDDWNAFCDTCTSSDLGSNNYPAVPARRSLLKANFNPNSRLNKFNPNRSMWNMVDKQDLLVYSTEFVLEPVHAHEVESVGRVLGKNGRLLASRTLRCEISGPKVARLSTQREFVCQDLGNLDKAGDETGVRIPGVDSPFLPPSQGNGIKTWGQDLPGLSAGGVKQGVGIQPYPEPYVDLDPASATWNLALSPADYDGSLQLATLETDADYTYGVTAGSNDMKMLARWTADLDLAVSDADPARGSVAATAKWKNQPDICQAPLANSLLAPSGTSDISSTNTLHPDGCYSERDRTPGYFDKNNANGLHGLMSFWMKPDYHVNSYLDEDASLTPTAGSLVRGHQLVKWSNYYPGAGGGIVSMWTKDQLFGLTHHSSDYGPAAFICMFEVAHDVDDTDREHRFRTPARVTRPHRWGLLTFAWDLQAPANRKDDVGEMVLDDGTGTNDLGSLDSYLYTGNDPASASDLTNNDRFGDYNKNLKVAGNWPHLIFLGRRGFLGEGSPFWGNYYAGGFGANVTFDEFSIYDFGGATYVSGISTTATTGTLASPGDLAAARFNEGRYYRESDYGGLAGSSNKAARWYSAPLDLGGGSLRALSWTQVVPRGLRAPLPEPPAKAGVDGDGGEDGRIEMEISNLPGTGYAPDASGNPIDTTFRNSALSRVVRTPAGPFRLHAVFQPNLELSSGTLDTPILDPLALDDVTVVYEPLGGRRIVTWGPGE